MHINRVQAAEMLHCTKNTVSRYVEKGLLKPLNSRKPGAKKFFPKFNSKDVRALMTSLKPTRNGSGPTQLDLPEPASSPIPRRVSPQGMNPTGIKTQLDRIEAMLERLLTLWS